MSYDPIKDEHKLFTHEEFIAEAKAALDEYEKTFHNQNEFHRSSHTWREWFNSFVGFMSW